MKYHFRPRGLRAYSTALGRGYKQNRRNGPIIFRGGAEAKKRPLRCMASGISRRSRGVLQSESSGALRAGRTRAAAHAANTTSHSRPGTDKNMHETIAFASSCPKCRQERSERGFSRAALLRLLNADHPIEAYCGMCDEFWCISPEERAAIASQLNGRGTRAPLPRENAGRHA